MTRAFTRALAGGLGTVTLYFMTDDATDDGIPDAATVSDGRRLRIQERSAR